ncbi:hypothetical protein Zmor_020854 [Zophobas morio]|uniref:Uncharacterized protein n=1 Tax=Zophobas morio TaxID=2755281 RepID=A0AA38I797_9CUCU|nr:hypothetical protein Zmor_020854 [Zophobas morio]
MMWKRAHTEWHGTRRLYVEEVVQYRPVCVFPLQTALVSLVCSAQCLLADSMMDLRLLIASLVLAAVLPGTPKARKLFNFSLHFPATTNI